MFTLKELRILADLVDSAPIQGTLLSLPGFLKELTEIRIKIQGAMKMLENNENGAAVIAARPIENEQL